jgi:hypothetical protein
MKRFLTSLLASLTLAVGLLAPVSATTGDSWTINMSDPTSSTIHTINIAYQAFSTVAEDDMTVTLFGIPGGNPSQTTTKDYGDSGAFQVTLADGSYSVHLEATNSGDSGNTKTTPVETFNVSTAQNVTIVRTVNSGSTAGSGTSTASSTGGSSTSGGTSSTGTGTNTGTGGNTSTSNGDVNAPGTSKTQNDNGEVLGVEATNNHTVRNAWITGIAAVAVVLLALYYWLVRRANRTT